MIIDSIRNDAAWNQGEYQNQPAGLRAALEVLYFMGSNPLQRYNEAPTLTKAPPELGILEREIKRVPRGKALVMPMTDQTRGHGTHTLAAVWKEYLAELLKESERSA
jgi:homoserine O-acetyltransferase